MPHGVGVCAAVVPGVALDCSSDRERVPLGVYVGPLEAEGFPLAEPERESESEPDAVSMRCGDFENPPGLRHGEGVYLFLDETRSFRDEGGVLDDLAAPESLVERRTQRAVYLVNRRGLEALCAHCCVQLFDMFWL